MDQMDLEDLENQMDQPNQVVLVDQEDPMDQVELEGHMDR
jgi:hypothetical protein